MLGCAASCDFDNDGYKSEFAILLSYMKRDSMKSVVKNLETADGKFKFCEFDVDGRIKDSRDGIFKEAEIVRCSPEGVF